MKSTNTEPRTKQEYITAIDQMLARMRRMDEQMKADRREIERLQAETRAGLDEIRTILRSLQERR